MLDDHADQLLAMTDLIAQRARKLGGATLRSISDISRHQRLQDNNNAFVPPQSMMAELREDNCRLARSLRSTHRLCGQYGDVGTTSLIEAWIDETEQRAWFLAETLRGCSSNVSVDLF